MPRLDSFMSLGAKSSVESKQLATINKLPSSASKNSAPLFTVKSKGKSIEH